jgi:hypothetical protein
LLLGLIPSAKPGGRPRKVDMWEILNAIFASSGGGVSLAGSARGFSGMANGVHLFSELAPRRNMGTDARPSAGVASNGPRSPCESF